MTGLDIAADLMFLQASEKHDHSSAKISVCVSTLCIVLNHPSHILKILE